MGYTRTYSLKNLDSCQINLCSKAYTYVHFQMKNFKNKIFKLSQLSVDCYNTIYGNTITLYLKIKSQIEAYCN